MCFFSSPKGQSAPPVQAPPPPQPVPVPADTNPVNTADQYRSKIDALKYGVLSTIKTSPAGITGAGPDLVSSATGGNYANLFPSANKTKLGS